MLYVGSWYFLVMKEFLKKLIVGVLLIICIGLNFEKSNIIADEDIDKASNEIDIPVETDFGMRNINGDLNNEEQQMENEKDN